MTGPREVSHTPRARTRRSGAVRTRMRSERTMSLARLIRPSTPANGESHTPSTDRKSTRLNSSHGYISYAVFCLKKKKNHTSRERPHPPTRHPTTTPHHFCCSPSTITSLPDSIVLTQVPHRQRAHYFVLLDHYRL